MAEFNTWLQRPTGQALGGPYFSLTFDPSIVRKLGDGKALVLAGDQPDLTFSLTTSGYSLAAFFDRKVREDLQQRGPLGRWQGGGPYYRWFGSILPLTGVTVLGSYATHENGHSYQRDNDLHGGDPLVRVNLSTAGGMNATMVASQNFIREPYEGVMSDLAYIVHKLDLPFYILYQDGVYFQATEEEGDGDIQAYENALKSMGYSHKKVRLPLVGLLHWELLDLVNPVRRVINYGVTGEVPENPYQPGDWTLKTTGTLSPLGPLYGLQVFYFFDRRTELPSSLSLEGWSGVVHQDRARLPAGFRIEASRINLPWMTGPVGYALSGYFALSEMDVDNLELQEAIDWPLVTMGGGAGLHLQMEEGEVSVQLQCKQKGLLRDQLFQEGCTVLTGFKVATGNLF